MAYLLAGAFVALMGIGAVFFFFRRKSVDKRSMYSARREQIEHKVRAARQRTLAPHGHVEKAPEPVAAAAASPFEQPQAQPTVRYEVAAYQAPPAAPPAAPTPSPAPAAESMPWEQPQIPPPAPAPIAPAFDFPPASPEPFPSTPAPDEPVWTPAPMPAEPLAPAEPVTPVTPVAPVAPAASSTSVGGWEIVSTAKDSSVGAEPESRKKGKGAQTSSWQLASGEAPGDEADQPQVGSSSGTVRAIAQYAVLVVGLVMVLIGVLVMVANSHVT